MTVVWDDVNARARGLATHLLDRIRLERLAGSSDLPTLAAELDRLGYGPAAPPDRSASGVSAAAVELALRRGAAARLRTLRRWCGGRVARLAVLFEDEDRRSLRALLCGAVAGVSPDLRLAGLIPTPGLPVKALDELARQETPAALSVLLVAWGNPYGPVLLDEAGRAHPDLLLLDLALNRRFAERALRAARGSRDLLAYVRQVIDLENASSALVLAGGRSDLAPNDFYLPGGVRPDLPEFIRAAAAGDHSEAAGILAGAFKGTPFGNIFLRCAREPGEVEPEILRARIHEQAQAARRAPLGPAVLLGYALRLRAEAMDLRLIAWGLALGVPRGSIVTSFVGPT